MKRTTLVIAILPAIALSLLLTGCGKTAAEKATEKAIERASNGNVNVDVSGENVNLTINTNQGTVTGSTGGSVSLPSGFPSDVYVIGGVIKTAMTNTSPQGYTLSIETTKTPAQAKDLYEADLKAQGWTITFTMATGSGSTLAAEKGSRTVSVITSESDGKTTVILGVTEKPAAS